MSFYCHFNSVPRPHSKPQAGVLGLSWLILVFHLPARICCMVNKYQKYKKHCHKKPSLRRAFVLHSLYLLSFVVLREPRSRLWGALGSELGDPKSPADTAESSQQPHCLQCYLGRDCSCSNCFQDGARKRKWVITQDWKTCKFLFVPSWVSSRLLTKRISVPFNLPPSE